MIRKIISTTDGSNTIYVPGLNEHYHSINGAVTETMHIFINAGFNSIQKKSIRILEYGMGTGLNLFATLDQAIKRSINVHYHTIEKYPLCEEEWGNLNIPEILNVNRSCFNRIHTSSWDELITINKLFTIYKEKSDFRTATPEGQFDLIYYDAFSPDIQPHLWQPEIFQKIAHHCVNGAVLTTYSSKGIVKRALKDAGFSIEKIPGPPGKREFIRASITS